MFNLEDGIKWYLVFLFSTTLHEAAHAWTALKLGDDTAARSGQVTLNPAPHIKREPFGMVVVPLATYLMSGWMIGWASAPYNPRWALQFPQRSALMALAGPAANFLLVIISAILIKIGIGAGVFSVPAAIDFLTVTEGSGDGMAVFAAEMVSLFFSLNLLLGCFNLLPLPPLDGSSLPLLFVRGKLAETLQSFLWTPTTSWAGIIIAWNVFQYVYEPVQLSAVRLLYPGMF
ncbi:MAG TPA: site-2 protease family protein [Chthoniobacterales bacterium]